MLDSNPQPGKSNDKRSDNQIVQNGDEYAEKHQSGHNDAGPSKNLDSCGPRNAFQLSLDFSKEFETLFLGLLCLLLSSFFGLLLFSFSLFGSFFSRNALRLKCSSLSLFRLAISRGFCSLRFRLFRHIFLIPNAIHYEEAAIRPLE